MKICIVGGGTAGWISLSYLAATTKYDLTILHSNEIDAIGVGESTTPTIKHLVDVIGIDEKTWMKDSKATFKYGIEFKDFAKKGSRWFHSFDDQLPHQVFHQPVTHNGKLVYDRQHTSIDYFLQTYPYESKLFNNTHGPLEYLLEKELSPFNEAGIPNNGNFPGYSYHLNAQLFGDCLKKHTPVDRYTEINATVTDVVINDNLVQSIKLDNGNVIEADIFIDCTGFHRLLISKFSKFQKYTDLKNNAAIFGIIPGYQINRPSTVAHAQDYGWIWTTPTVGQVGTGYVYSDDYISEQYALDTLNKYWEDRGQKFQLAKSVKFTAGRQEKLSFGNVISNGLAQSFIEPLEATSLMVTCVTVKSLVTLLNKPRKTTIESITKVHSKHMEKFIDHTKYFVYMHYALSSRNDTDYWKDVGNKENADKQATDYIINRVNTSQWLHSGETLLNQFNWVSMLIGYDKSYGKLLPKFNSSEIENYKWYTENLMANYKFITRNNIPVKDLLIDING